MLLGNQPQLALAFGTVACPQQRDVAALDTAAAGQQLDTRELAGPFDQLVVAGTRVGLEIGEPDLVLFSLDLER
ncbi:hypothetical protein D3C71_2196310 [compost metagenome]